MIQVEKEPDHLRSFPLEACCFCREKTSHWTKDLNRKPGEQVACCEKCAKKANYEDLPTKKQWCKREEISWRGF
jgi:hypothetical protein